MEEEALPMCGDGIVDPEFVPPDGNGPEECDPPSDIAGCSATCRIQHCGNGVSDPGEECDDGNAVADDNCFNCRIENPSCGDGVITPRYIPPGAAGPEQCDPPSVDIGCSSKCRVERCGNGVVDRGEECDGSTGLQPCSSTCRQQRCGNGIVDPSEECDDGAANNNSADCRADCVINRCGDGHINTSAGPNHEDCDGGPIATARDRTAVPTNAANCNSNCTTPSCGDNIVNPLFRPVMNSTLTEQCDDDGNVGGDGCSATCQLERCGNGVIDPHEQCDDGDADNTDGCTTLCQFARCGDGFTQQGVEQCDDADTDNTDDCTTLCRSARCGDGFIRSNPTLPANAEECDNPTLPTDCPYSPANTPCQVCNASCDLVAGQTLFCGDGIVQAGREVCDGGTRGCGACSTSCSTVFSEAATGLILAVGGAPYAAGDRFTMGDGVVTTTFELTKTGTVGAGRTPINIADSDTAFQVATKIADAIDNTALRIRTEVLGNAILLTHQRSTTTGNVTIIPTVATAANLIVDGMEGGQGGQCVTGQPCKVGAECASNQCNTITGVCIAP